MMDWLCGWLSESSNSGDGGGESRRRSRYEVASVGDSERRLMIDLIIGELEVKLKQLPPSVNPTSVASLSSDGGDGAVSDEVSTSSLLVDYSWLVGVPRCRRGKRKDDATVEVLTPYEKSYLEELCGLLVGEEFGQLIGTFRARCDGCRTKEELLQVFRFSINEIVNARPRNTCWSDRLKEYFCRHRGPLNSICYAKRDADTDQIEMISQRRQDGSQLTVFDLV